MLIFFIYDILQLFNFSFVELWLNRFLNLLSSIIRNNPINLHLGIFYFLPISRWFLYVWLDIFHGFNVRINLGWLRVNRLFSSWRRNVVFTFATRSAWCGTETAKPCISSVFESRLAGLLVLLPALFHIDSWTLDPFGLFSVLVSCAHSLRSSFILLNVVKVWWFDSLSVEIINLLSTLRSWLITLIFFSIRIIITRRHLNILSLALILIPVPSALTIWISCIRILLLVLRRVWI